VGDLGVGESALRTAAGGASSATRSLLMNGRGNRLTEATAKRRLNPSEVRTLCA
jgi:hypothetical protein